MECVLGNVSSDFSAHLFAAPLVYKIMAVILTEVGDPEVGSQPEAFETWYDLEIRMRLRYTPAKPSHKTQNNSK